jgi:hypothetical protein
MDQIPSTNATETGFTGKKVSDGGAIPGADADDASLPEIGKLRRPL